MLRKINIGGSSYVGVFCRCSDRLALIPLNMTSEWKAEVAEALGVEMLETTMGGCMILGSLVCMNSSGAVIADIATSEEVSALSKGMNVARLEHKLNAAGNNILANDKVALVHPDYDARTQRLIGDALGVEVVAGTVAGIKNVGSAAVATGKGVLCHPYTTKEEMDAMREVFGVQVQIGTANYGTPLVGACLVANSKGAIVGEMTTGVELNRIEDTLGFI